MNIGLKAYQDKWAANVLSNMKQYGWDGVVVDNANMDPSGYKALPYDEYPTRESYQAATRSFLANFGPALMSQGFIVIPNIQHHGSLLTESLWKDWVQFTSGGHLEHYTKWGSESGNQDRGFRLGVERPSIRPREPGGGKTFPVRFRHASDARLIALRASELSSNGTVVRARLHTSGPASILTRG
jgi:hypothetical protein